MTLSEILEFNLISIGKYHLSVYQVLFMLVIFLITRILLWALNKYLMRKVRQEKLDEGKRYALYQVSTYVFYVIAISIALESIGIKLTVLLAGSTALLVGVGLGLQDFFRDLVAGFIILTERVITVDDVVEIAGIVGQVQEVGLRTTTVITRDDIVMIIPNQNLTTDKVVNWSQNRKPTRFTIDVGVAYGSDTALVEKILTEVAKEHHQVTKKNEIRVFFSNFGESSLDFKLTFFSNELFRIERIKSDLRYAIDRKFRESGITIPFPQRDLWVKEIPKNTPPA